MKKYEVVIQLNLCRVTVEVEVKDDATEKEIEWAADCRVQEELNYSKIDTYREINEFL